MQAAKIRAYANIFVTKTNMYDLNDIAYITMINATFDNVFTNVAVVSLSSLIPLDLLCSTMSQPNAYLLYVSNDYSVGETRVKSNPIIDIFFDGPRTSFIGGAGVSYFLYHENMGGPVWADHIDGYVGYRQFSKFTWWKYVQDDLNKR
jgi:hypothetical protein